MITFFQEGTFLLYIPLLALVVSGIIAFRGSDTWRGTESSKKNQIHTSLMVSVLALMCFSSVNMLYGH